LLVVYIVAFVGFILTVKHQCMVMKYLKLMNIQQAKVKHTCNNTKEKLHWTNVAIWFNHLCRVWLSLWYNLRKRTFL